MSSESSPSLTPARRSQEATETAMRNGVTNGVLTLVPTVGAVYLAMQNSKTFLARTNMQSRTAIAIMPALFAFAWTSERALEGKMQAIAKDEASEHKQQLDGIATEAQLRWAQPQPSQRDSTALALQQQQQLNMNIHNMDMYRKAVEESNVCIVPGDRLSLHHRMANFVNDNPIKVLASLAVPSVAWIFWGNNNKNMNFSIKVMHTRVFGQFATLSLLLGVMGFKEFMDQNGRFITESEADAQVAEMHQARQNLLVRLEEERQHQLERQQAIAMAHEEDVREHNVHTHKKRHGKKNYKKTHGSGDEHPAVAMSH